ncbi:MAG TPA: hypothetical protein VHB74_05600 [Devosia sp.]|nr:hypothetical protein [Devosia sp.]
MAKLMLIIGFVAAMTTLGFAAANAGTPVPAAGQPAVISRG